ncbi:MAG: sulfite reductase subunit alpha, partial [Planctomycetota bacterium]
TANLKDVPDELIELVAETATDEEEKARILGLLEDDDAMDTLDVLDLLKMAKSAVVDVKAFSKTLPKLQPRLYSIASSLKAYPDQVHLTIAKVTYDVGDRTRKGVASTMFADRLEVGDKTLVYAHAAPGFTVPSDPSAPMIMVGPGTGVAPFRAFLQERQVTEAPGKNWLFFGDQHEATDFLYKNEFAAMRSDGLLTKLSTAFSRDQEEKVYVQHRMIEEGAELYDWLEQGGYFFVCGDAKRMAGDVDRALHTLIAEHGKLSEDDAKAYVKRLKDDNRYVRDVY